MSVIDYISYMDLALVLTPFTLGALIYSYNEWRKMKNKKFFTEDDYDEISAEHVFYHHLYRRDDCLSQIKSSKIKMSSCTRELLANQLAYEDEFLREYIKARKFYKLEINDVMKSYRTKGRAFIKKVRKNRTKL